MIDNMNGAIERDLEEIKETQQLVVATKDMPKPDWVKASVFSWICGFLYFDKVLPRAEYHYKSAISGSSNIMNFRFN